jgi:hypothetical protein
LAGEEDKEAPTLEGRQRRERPCENIRERVVSLAVLALFASSLALSQDLEVKAPRVP